MFNATLDSVGAALAEAREAAELAIRELTAIHALTWHTETGQAFIRRSGELAAEINRLCGHITQTQDELLAARRELDELETRILRLQLAA